MIKKRFFSNVANWTSHQSGKPITFLLACFVIIIWLLTGPIFDFNDTWQLVINTATTIITFLMVFLIQNTQNRDTMALQLKLDELIYVTKKAHNALLNIEELSEDELTAIRKNYDAIAIRAKKNVNIEQLYAYRKKRPHKKLK